MLITTGAGALKAEVDGNLVRARGIRYAKAARFAAPEPVTWDGVLDATQRGPACPQLPSSLVAVVGPSTTGLTFDEQCQVLTVTAPADASGLPVMVWFHGGAYTGGSGESLKYDPSNLADEGQVVVVNVSYRLGVFGYLTGNLGLLDQLVALCWVRDNVAAFGGDPGNVTIFGQSAGADSVYALMLCDDEGLFHRAIMQSAPLGTRSDDTGMTARMVEAMRAAAPADLGAASCDAVLAAQKVIAVAAAPFGLRGGGMPFGPHFGETPLPPEVDIPARIAAAAQRIELLVGHTADDGSPYVAAQPDLWPLVTEQVFAAGARELAEAWTAAGGSAATYNFVWRAANAPLGACHCMELPFLFGAPEAWADAGMLAGEQPPVALAQRVRQVWSGFAHRGVAALETRSLTFE